MFETLLAPRGMLGKRLRKGATLVLSLAAHALAVAAVIVVPLLRAETALPAYAVIDAALISPPVLPGIPPAGRPRGTGDGPGRSPGEPVKPRPRTMEGFLVPREISLSTEEDLNLALPSGGGEGVDGGIDLEENGNNDWVIDRGYVPDELEPSRAAVWAITPPRLIRKVSPAYPPAAIAARVAGAVVVAAATDVYGRVSEARVVSGHPLLNAAAVEAVREWLYEPYLVNGVPKAVRFTVTVTFVLEKR
ncbi:MAG TPA: energy transducer TonB [Candidatus Aminicenantes bacterium]|nr:energy transducer TonB [Candidatus Aminicenantes bacterium]